MVYAWKTIRVFICSTFLDMQAERDHLVRFAFPRLREQLLPRRIHLVDVDLRWGVTGEQDASEVCREIIEECRPRFLCMLGGRYGWVPPGSTMSITDLEVHFGVLDRELEDRGFAYFYFRDDTATTAMVETTPGELREPQDSDNQHKLAELKRAIVTADLRPFTYQAQWDNENKRLTGLRKFGDRVYDDLLNSMKCDPELQDRFATNGVEELDEFIAENAAMEAFVEERGERFVLGSREPMLEELLAHAGANDSSNYVCLTGPPGSGKSAMLAHFSRHPTLISERSTLLIRHFVGASPGSTDMRRTLRRLCHELKASCADITADIPDNPEKLRDTLPNFLRQACARHRVVILVDAVNQFDPALDSDGLHWLPADLPDNARIILSSPDHPALEDFRRRTPKPREIDLKPLTMEDGEAISKQFCQRYHKKFEPEQRAALLAKTDADSPLYLLAALEELRTLGTYEEISQRIDELPPTTQELFAWILKRLENDDIFRDAAGRRIGGELVSRMAALLGASRHGLSQHELTDLLDAEDPQGNVAALLHLLRPYLMRRGELLDFYHDQFRAAAEEAWLKTDKERQAAHEQLAGYFDKRWRTPDTHALLELVTQQTLSENWDALETTLTDVAFLQAKATPELWTDLLADLEKASRVGPQSSGRKDILTWLAPRLPTYCKHPDSLRNEVANELLPTVTRERLRRGIEEQLTAKPAEVIRSVSSAGGSAYLRYPHGLAEHGVDLLQVARDAPIAVTGDSNGVISAWDLGTGHLLRFWDLESRALGLAVSADGQRVAVRGSKGVYLLFFDRLIKHVESRQWIEEDLIHPRNGEERYGPVVATSDDKSVLSVWASSRLVVWDWQSGRIRAVFELPNDDRIRAYVTTREHVLIATAKGRALRFEIESGTSCDEIFSIPGGSISGVASSIDGRVTAWAITSPSIAARLDDPVYADNPWFQPYDLHVILNGSTVTIDEVDGPRRLWMDEAGEYLVAAKHEFTNVYSVSLATTVGMGQKAYGSRSGGRVASFRGEWALAPDGKMILVCQEERPFLCALMPPFDSTPIGFPSLQHQGQHAVLLSVGAAGSHAAWRERGTSLLHFWTKGSDVAVSREVSRPFSWRRQLSRDGRVAVAVLSEVGPRKRQLKITFAESKSLHDGPFAQGHDRFYHESISPNGLFVTAECADWVDRQEENLIHVFKVPNATEEEAPLVGRFSVRFSQHKVCHPETVCVADSRGELWAMWHESVPDFPFGLVKWNISNLGQPPDLIELAPEELAMFERGVSRGGRVVFIAKDPAGVLLLAFHADCAERRAIFRLSISNMDSEPRYVKLRCDLDSTGSYAVVAYYSIENIDSSLLWVVDLRDGRVCQTDAAAWRPKGRATITSDGAYVASICDDAVAIWKTDLSNGTIGFHGGFWVDSPIDLTFDSNGSLVVLTASGDFFRYEIRGDEHGV